MPAKTRLQDPERQYGPNEASQTWYQRLSGWLTGWAGRHNPPADMQPSGPITYAPATGPAEKIDPPNPMTITTWRSMWRDPIVALAASLPETMIRRAQYAVETKEGVPAEIVEFVDEVAAKIWRKYMHDASFVIQSGFQPFEEVWGIERGRRVIVRLKPLTPERTTALLDSEGELRGLLNVGQEGRAVTLSEQKMLWLTMNKFCDNPYGQGFAERAQAAWERKLDAERRMAMYMKKQAGILPVVRGPGQTEVRGAGGATVAASHHAQTILNAALEGRGIFMPAIGPEFLRDLADRNISDPQKFDAWSFQVIAFPTGAGAEILEAKQDAVKDIIRAFGVSERAVIEGQFGTKAESETQTDTSLDALTGLLEGIVDTLNETVIDELVETNFGPQYRGKVYVTVSSGMQDREKSRLFEILKLILQNPLLADMAADLLRNSIDLRNIVELLDIPIIQPGAEPEIT